MPGEVRERVILAHQTDNMNDFTVELFLAYGMEEGEWVGVCKQLGIAANADTLDETKEILKDLILLQLNGVEGLTSISGRSAQETVPAHNAPSNRTRQMPFLRTILETRKLKPKRQPLSTRRVLCVDVAEAHNGRPPNARGRQRGKTVLPVLLPRRRQKARMQAS